MDFDSSDNSGTHYSGKVKIKTFEEFQLEQLTQTEDTPTKALET